MFIQTSTATIWYPILLSDPREYVWNVWRYQRSKQKP